MRKLLLLLALNASFAAVTIDTPTASAAVKSTDITKTAQIGTDTYKLAIKVRDVPATAGDKATRADYSVFQNNRFMPQTNGDYIGGTTIGCGALDVSEARVGDRFLGWILGRHCGNPGVFRFDFVKIDPTRKNYLAIRLSSTIVPIFRKVGDKIEMWTIKQVYGKGGTATSFYVPQVNGYDDNMAEVYPYPLPTDWKSWPTFPYTFGFNTYFVAGIQNHNANLMEKALALGLDKETTESNKLIGLPATADEAKGLIEAVRKYGEAFELFK